MALEFDALLRAYECDAVIETGTYCGETTEYLARAYPQLAIYSCDVAKLVERIQDRLRHLPNVTIRRASSPDFLRTLPSFRSPLYFLDAHGEADWPLPDELRFIPRGIICIHDFDIGRPEYGFDSYGGICIDKELVKEHGPLYVNNPDHLLPWPSDATFLRGRGYLLKVDEDHLQRIPLFKRVN